MAGLWELVSHTHPDDDRLDNHHGEAMFGLYLEGVFTASEAKAAIEAVLGRSLVTAEEDDINAMVAVLDAKSNVTLKLRYYLLVKNLFTAAEDGSIGESAWRAALEIS